MSFTALKRSRMKEIEQILRERSRAPSEMWKNLSVNITILQ